jgi:hypothetical protein
VSFPWILNAKLHIYVVTIGPEDGRNKQKSLSRFYLCQRKILLDYYFVLWVYFSTGGIPAYY